MSVAPELDAVIAALKDAAEVAIIPRFRRLAETDIHQKGVDDPVTIADREAEDMLTRSLPLLLPGSIVVGEEAVSANPAVMDLLDTDSLIWLVDPVDGTANFVAGKETFGVMTALIYKGEPVMSIIYAPISGRIVTAEKGAGAFVDGRRLKETPESGAFDQLRGAVMTHFMPAETAAILNQGATGLGERLSGLRACAFEYPSIANAERDFSLFGKTMPWDHSPGAVILGETGGVVRFLDGAPYSPRRRQAGLMAARNADVWETAAAGIFPDGDPFVR